MLSFSSFCSYFSLIPHDHMVSHWSWDASKKARSFSQQHPLLRSYSQKSQLLMTPTSLQILIPLHQVFNVPTRHIWGFAFFFDLLMPIFGGYKTSNSPLDFDYRCHVRIYYTQTTQMPKEKLSHNNMIFKPPWIFQWPSNQSRPKTHCYYNEPILNYFFVFLMV